MRNLPNMGERIGAWSGTAAALRALIDNLEQGVYVLDRQGRCLAVNHAFRRWLNRPEGELLGCVLFDYWPAHLAPREADEHQRILRGERIEKEEEWPLGRRVPRVRILKVPVQDAQGQTCGMLCLLRDAPPLRPAPLEEKRALPDEPLGGASAVQAWRCELLGRLAAGIAHDLRNLLTLLVAPLAMLRSALPANRATEEPLRALSSAIGMGSALVERLLMVIRGSGGGTTAIDVNAACADVAELLQKSIAPRLELQLHLRPDLPPARGGATELRQVLLNLCLNACDAMPRGGKLQIATDQPLAAIGAEGGGFLCVRVSDTGEGMPPEVRERIFDPFFTTRDSGRNTGQGLAIASELVRQMGGRLECSSAVGVGTTFTIWLPALEAAPIAPSALSPPPARKRILIIEKDPGIVSLVRAILEPRGFQILQADDPRNAETLHRRRLADIDVVLLECTSQDSSVAETMAQLLSINPGLRLILVSGAGAPDPAGLAGVPGVGFLTKPYTPDQLVRTVQEVLAVEQREEGDSH